jgi:hypothetical protein
MTWFRVDDNLGQNMKLLLIPHEHRAAAVGLWTLAGAWAANQLTDGYVPDYVVAELSGSAHRETLTSVGLWVPVSTPVSRAPGVQFHDWSEYQPSRAEVVAERARHAANQRAYIERRKAARDAANADRSAADHNSVRTDRSLTTARPDPTRPDPTRPGRSSYGTTSDSKPVPRARSRSTAADRAEAALQAGLDVEADRAEARRQAGRDFQTDRINGDRNRQIGR